MGFPPRTAESLGSPRVGGFAEWMCTPANEDGGRIAPGSACARQNTHVIQPVDQKVKVPSSKARIKLCEHTHSRQYLRVLNIGRCVIALLRAARGSARARSAGRLRSSVRAHDPCTAADTECSTAAVAKAIDATDVPAHHGHKLRGLPLVIEESRQSGELRTGCRRGVGLELARELLLEWLDSPGVESCYTPEHVHSMPG
jgi:hypothetical protein